MSDFHLVIGNKNYSSRSFSLCRPDTSALISSHGLGRAVPALVDGDIRIKEAIKEWMLAADAEPEIIEQAEN